MSVKKFIIFSVLVHICILIGIYFIPKDPDKKPAAFLANLITPEELPKPGKMPPSRPPGILKRKGPARLPQKELPSAANPKTVPSKETPVFPGMGKEDREFQHEKISPDRGIGESVEQKGNSDSKSRIPGEKGLKGGPAPSIKEKLYDPEVIGNIAMRDPETGRKEESSITFDTSDYRYIGYMRKLKEKIESIWEYPPEAVSRRLYGDLKLRFTILKSGKLGSIELVRTSGYKTLDDAAIRALRDGEPYWPVPEEWGMESYTITGHFIYSMYGYSLR